MFRSNPSRNQAEAGHPLRSAYGSIVRAAARHVMGSGPAPFRVNPAAVQLGPFGECSGAYIPETLTAAPIRAPYVTVPIVEKRFAAQGQVPLALQPRWPRPLPWRRRA